MKKNGLRSNTGRIYDLAHEYGFHDLLANKIMAVRIWIEMQPDDPNKEGVLKCVDEIIAGLEVRRAEIAAPKLSEIMESIYSAKGGE